MDFLAREYSSNRPTISTKRIPDMKTYPLTGNSGGNFPVAKICQPGGWVRERLITPLLVSALLVATGCTSTGSKEGSSFRADKDPLYDGTATITFDSMLAGDSDAGFEQLGDLALRQDEQDKAIYAYLRAIQTGGDKAELFSKIGAVHQARRNHELALQAYSRALQANPEFIPALQGAGLVNLGLRQYQDARHHLELAVILDQQRVSNLNGALVSANDSLGGPAATSGENDRNASDEAQPDNRPMYDFNSPHQAYNGLGVLADLTGEHPQAQRYYQIADAIRPNSAITHNNLGYSHYLSGELTAAEHHFLRAINLNPRFKRGWRNLALVYVRQGRHEDALATLGQVMNTAQAYNNLGYLSMLGGDHAEAERLLQQAIALSPSYYELAQENLEQNRNRNRRNAAPPGM
jgi:tetratricopeptide (TPR) repeat protein